MLGAAAASAFTAVTWHQLRSPFYAFNHRSAESRLQNLIILTLVLILLTIVAIGTRRWQTVEASGDVEQDSAEIHTNTLHPSASATPQSLAQLVTATPTFEPTATRPPTKTPEPPRPPNTSPGPNSGYTLPEVYGSVPLRVPTGPDATIRNLVFATRIFPNSRPADPNDFFSTEIETLYATFEYRHMSDDMAWSWVWRKGGKVIDGGNMYWTWGNNGPAYVYLQPDDGFEAGIYSAEIWLNNELVQHAEVEIFDMAEPLTPDEPVLVVTTPELFKAPFNRMRDLPPLYNQVQAKLDVTAVTTVEIVDFGVEMTRIRTEDVDADAGIRPIALTATFRHNGMENGMSWSWVWRLNDEIIGGGNQEWRYDGNDPRGIIHLLPETIETGEYSLELWVNGMQMSQAVLNVTGTQ